MNELLRVRNLHGEPHLLGVKSIIFKKKDDGIKKPFSMFSYRYKKLGIKWFCESPNESYFYEIHSFTYLAGDLAQCKVLL